MVFKPSDFAPHPCQEHLAKAGDTLGCQDLVGEVEMLQRVEARYAADHPSVHRRPPLQRLVQPQRLTMSGVRKSRLKVPVAFPPAGYAAVCREPARTFGVSTWDTG